jgi:hypothetical protein
LIRTSGNDLSKIWMFLSCNPKREIGSVSEISITCSKSVRSSSMSFIKLNENYNLKIRKIKVAISFQAYPLILELWR